jgi:hypothetical protein
VVGLPSGATAVVPGLWLANPTTLSRYASKEHASATFLDTRLREVATENLARTAGRTSLKGTTPRHEGTTYDPGDPGDCRCWNGTNYTSQTGPA